MMLAAQFKNRFLLQPGLPPQSELLPIEQATHVKQSAVLVPIIDYGDRLSVLFTQRCWHLTHHPGQISFPGGKLEHAETPAAAALRETEEEIGVTANRIQLLGQLGSHHTLTGFQISPWVGLLPAGTPIIADPAEVSAVFEVPLTFFLDPRNCHELWLPLRGQARQLHFMPFENKLIWGATAAIMAQLLQHIR
ncbi:CoA pyrophosphatase [Alishewanella sp. 16-MA]|uniref:CoA pyrophosphatase n=1 Tax=Alishewanella maricola TaxID=2795740 RepID=A0ABS8C3G2_9ALTE|nr:CoA pyrophosphatase [Alishewanella maricola]MCB5226868.1 CoA pyrophosphatase [Alishewanella maricola]